MQLIRSVMTWLAAVLSVLSFGAHSDTDAASQADVLVYFGTYTGKGSRGVYVSRLDPSSGKLGAPELAAEARNPSFLAVHPSRPLLYAVNEVSSLEGKPTGAVSAFAVDRVTGKLSFLNLQPSGGADPAHLSVDKAGRNVLVANYTGGSISVFPIDEDGRLKPASAFVQHTGSSVDPDRQKRPHAHAINVDTANRRSYVADLGLDKVLIYRFDPERGSLTPDDPPFASVRPGSGPRHLAVHASGRFMYVINEISCTVTAFAVDRTSGGLREFQTVSTLPPGKSVEAGYSTAEIMVHPSGRFLYGSNRGHDTIAVFAIDRESGRLALEQHVPTEGSAPRGFGVDRDGRYLIVGNQRSDSVVVFRIEATTGRLSPTGQKITVGSPVSVEFVY